MPESLSKPNHTVSRQGLTISVAVRATADQQATLSAYHFCGAALAAGHRLQVFFLQGAVYTALPCPQAPQDESQPHTLWRELAHSDRLQLEVCSTAVRRRGLENGIADGFAWSGLASFFNGIRRSDKVIFFGD